jgi:hypothetical protein
MVTMFWIYFHQQWFIIPGSQAEDMLYGSESMRRFDWIDLFSAAVPRSDADLQGPLSSRGSSPHGAARGAEAPIEGGEHR